jgi:hypothetical protein
LLFPHFTVHYSTQPSVLSLLLDISWQWLQQQLFLCLLLKSCLHRLPYRTHSQLSSKPHLAYNFSAQTTEKIWLFYCSSPVVALLRICCLAMGTCLPSRCPETALVCLPTLWSLHSNSSTCYNIHIMAKIMTFRGTEQIESNICIKDRILEQINTINYFR